MNKYTPGTTQCGWGTGVGCLCHGDKWVTDHTAQPMLYDLSIDPYEDYPIDPSTKE